MQIMVSNIRRFAYNSDEIRPKEEGEKKTRQELA
jgi:hypothetical protein